MRESNPEGARIREVEPAKESNFVMATIERRSPLRKEHEPSQDSGFSNPADGTAGVFDGVGNSKDSEVAAHLARETIEKALASIKLETDPDTIKHALQTALTEANYAINDLAASMLNDMRTTAVVTKMVRYDTGTKLFVAWVGDSRAQLVRNGQASILTVDDAAWFQFQNIPPSKRLAEQTRYANENIKGPARSNVITQSLGKYAYIHNQKGTLASKEPPSDEQFTLRPHIIEVPLLPGDKVVLSTDGLHDPVPLQTIGQIVNENSPEVATVKLLEEVDRVNRSQSPRRKKDDIFIVIMNEGTAS